MCYQAFMERIGIRELRQHASRWIDRARAGESIEVTDRDELVAFLVPAQRQDSTRDRLIAEGRLVPAANPGGLRDLPAAHHPPHTTRRRARRRKACCKAVVHAARRYRSTWPPHTCRTTGPGCETRLVIRLRPLNASDVETIDTAMNDPDRAGAYSWFGYEPGRMSGRFAREETLTAHGGHLAIETIDNHLLAGMASWYTRSNGPPPNGNCWMVGMFVLPGHRGHGVGTAAHQAIVRYLFAHTPAVRIEAGTESENVAERRALEHAGFVHEGTLRQAVFRDGQWRDSTIYSILRSDLDGESAG